MRRFKKNTVRGIICMAAVMAACVFSNEEDCHAQTLAKGDGITVYLDAGHDSRHSGTRKNGIKEEIANLAIAKAAKEELEKYEGVTVYMSRESMDCPYPGTSSGSDLSYRVADAAECQSDIYVSLHLNFSYYSSMRGAEVYYPNTNYNSKVSKTGKGVARKILASLKYEGVPSRGARVRSSYGGMRYPNGSRADYYAVIRQSKLRGFAGIIVEHAFVSNKSDVSNFLNTADKLATLGEADASGIAEYFDLKLKDTETVSLSRLTEDETGTVLLDWSEFDGADYYVIYRRSATETDWIELDTSEENVYNDVTVVDGETYYYTVAAHLSETDTFSKYNETGFKIDTVEAE